MIGMLLPVFAFVFFTSNDYNVFILMLIKTLLPTFICGFLIFGCVDYVNVKLGLLELSTQGEILVEEGFASSE